MLYNNMHVFSVPYLLSATIIHSQQIQDKMENLC